MTLSLAACAIDGAHDNHGDFVEQASRVEGIYRIDAHLMNEDSCLPGGESMPDQFDYAFAVRSSLFGHDFLSVHSCASLEACRRDARAFRDGGELGSFDFDFTLDQADADGLLGAGASTGFASGDGMCRMPEAWDTTLDLFGRELIIARAIREGRDYREVDGWCTTDEAQRAAKGVECSKMETLFATRVEAL